jgi:hypothetical protein
MIALEVRRVNKVIEVKVFKAIETVTLGSTKFVWTDKTDRPLRIEKMSSTLLQLHHFANKIYKLKKEILPSKMKGEDTKEDSRRLLG